MEKPQRIFTGRNVVELEIPVLLRGLKVRSVEHYDHGAHVRVDVTENPHDAGPGEAERAWRFPADTARHRTVDRCSWKTRCERWDRNWGNRRWCPTRIGNTCGREGLVLLDHSCDRVRRAPGPGDPVTGSSHTTTPEKSMCLRTAASCESRSSTRPETDPAARFVAPARPNSRLEKLKKVRERQVIVRIDQRARSQIRGAHLRRFKTCQYVRAQAIHDVRAIALVLPHRRRGSGRGCDRPPGRRKC